MFRNPAPKAVVLAVLLLIGAGVTVFARQAKLDAPNPQAPLLTGQIACVDMERVYAASGGPEQLAQRATEIALEVTQHLKDLKAVPFLDQNELQEYGALVFKANKTEADQARLKALKTSSDERQDELSKLQIKPDAMLTAQDKTRMKQLQEQSRLLDSIYPYLAGRRPGAAKRAGRGVPARTNGETARGCRQSGLGARHRARFRHDRSRLLRKRRNTPCGTAHRQARAQGQRKRQRSTK